MEAFEILGLAADIIERNGWTSGGRRVCVVACFAWARGPVHRRILFVIRAYFPRPTLAIK
ncbi:hypothetical protein GCM10022254_09740 [Actinomadura meridiana]|uniref:Uncharacterized protein n=1 Tax=Actinomadura meridiana TaxID=559626 RepID=A0ABP8BTX9_9ACTN